MTDSIDYGHLMHNAMRGLIKNVLEDVKTHGLPGEHHFFITFDTTHPDVQVADWLRERYPAEMTVVVQHWFDDLEIRDDGFSITLNFGDAPEPLNIPFDALRTFVDPSVEFGLQFEAVDDEDEQGLHSVDVETEIDVVVAKTPEPEATQKKDADIVSLDSFRK
ncbi:ClpXP protease specificity-enhancing factor SspB [Planktotalea sp.]|uniref:SspB family protein n=1 Tax=Planktotalea sp. TaxID=2029877 RepID=UPI0025EAC1CF|nr:ClpXP protease specificity-enhancing factor SspB [Planktotalea sp.]